ncbi:MAG: MarR family winged helix-turn-helix transcriptional regulator [Pauljensenia sp.]
MSHDDSVPAGSRATEASADATGRAAEVPALSADVELTELLQQTLRLYRRGMREHMDPSSPPMHQLRALRQFVAHGPMRPGHLAEVLGIAPRSATGVVDALEERGLVERSPDPHDRRAQVVTPTARAQAVLEATARAREDAARDLVAPLGGADRAELTRLLRLVLDSSQS